MAFNKKKKQTLTDNANQRDKLFNPDIIRTDRIPIWKALAELYLDTELQKHNYDVIFHELAKTGKSLNELKEIDLYEVFPTLQMNLNSIGGEWAGFKDDWLIEKCTKNYKKRHNKIFRFLTRLKNKRVFWMRQKHWAEIENRFEK